MDSIEGEDYDCTITLLKPVLQGSSSEETMAINYCMDELMEAWYDDVAGVVGEYTTFPKAVTFTSAALGTVSKSKIMINITGTVKPKTGSTKSIKYKITYDRNEENADVKKS